MTPGALDQKITLQTYSAVSDGAGGSSKTWADFASDASPWANVKVRGGKEITAEGGVAATATYVFTTRNRSDIVEADRIVWRNEVYNIRTVRREGVEGLYLVIDAERGAAT